MIIYHNDQISLKMVLSLSCSSLMPVGALLVLDAIEVRFTAESARGVQCGRELCSLAFVLGLSTTQIVYSRVPFTEIQTGQSIHLIWLKSTTQHRCTYIHGDKRRSELQPSGSIYDTCIYCYCRQ